MYSEAVIHYVARRIALRPRAIGRIRSSKPESRRMPVSVTRLQVRGRAADERQTPDVMPPRSRYRLSAAAATARSRMAASAVV
jgi:hypothetical protein